MTRAVTDVLRRGCWLPPLVGLTQPSARPRSGPRTPSLAFAAVSCWVAIVTQKAAASVVCWAGAAACCRFASALVSLFALVVARGVRLGRRLWLSGPAVASSASASAGACTRTCSTGCRGRFCRALAFVGCVFQGTRGGKWSISTFHSTRGFCGSALSSRSHARVTSALKKVERVGNCMFHIEAWSSRTRTRITASLHPFVDKDDGGGGGLGNGCRDLGAGG